jgi:hypothetical protein
MRKRYSTIIVSLFALCFLFELSAEPGILGTNQLRRNYLVDLYADVWKVNFSIGEQMYFGEDDLTAMSLQRVVPCITLAAQKEVFRFFDFRAKLTLGKHVNYYYPVLLKFYSAGLSSDLMLNLGDLFIEDAAPGTPKFWLFGGVGVEHSFEIPLHKKYEDNVTNSLLFNAGGYVEIPVSDVIDISLELRGTIVNDHIDGQALNFPYDGFASFLVGMTYHFY